MNTANAIGFLLLGMIMQTLPLTAAGTVQGAPDAQTLWLQFMGLITGAIGGGYLLRVAAGEVSVLVSRLALRRAEAREQIAQGARGQHSAPLGVRVTF